MANKTKYAPTKGALAFARFLKRNEVPDAEAARCLGVTDVTVYHWRIGAKVPKDLGRRKIEIFTRGAKSPGILPDAWDDGSEATELEAVQPLHVARAARQAAA